jgi:hypothetical protein
MKTDKKMTKLHTLETENKMEEIIKKVFLANQHKVMEVIAKEIGVKEEVLYFAFAKNKQVRHELMQVLQKQQEFLINNIEKGVA